MRNLQITRRVAIKADFTADQWQLFDGEGRDEAAAELNRALEKAVAADDNDGDGVEAAMRDVRAKHAHLGADDSEAAGLIERVVELAFG